MEKEENHNSSSADHRNDDQLDDLLQKLEQRTNWDGRRLLKYDGFWCPVRLLGPILSTRQNFKAKDSDIVLASIPKSGTTWLMALTFSIVNRSKFSIDESPLLTCHPHTLIPFLEITLYLHQENPNLEHLSSPRVLSTHMPFHVLPESVHGSHCKIIYICRNPLDQFISNRHFLLENKLEQGSVPLGLDESFDLFCDGLHPFGPFWDHIMGYWRAHLEDSGKVLFLKYEDLKVDARVHVKRIAEFIGFPFSEEEEAMGMVEEIARVCSFESLKNLEVNKSGHILGVFKNSSFFRKGQVGDWKNHLSPAMAQRLGMLVETKFEGSGLSFKNHTKVD